MILVTGSTGKVGSELVKRLREEGTSFRAVFHSPEKAEKGRASGLDTAVVDYARPETCRPLWPASRRSSFSHRPTRRAWKAQSSKPRRRPG